MKAALPVIQLPPLPGSVECGKVYRWSMDRLVRRDCPVCRADERETLCLRPDRLAVHRCVDCGLVYLAELPQDQDLDKFYAEYSEHKGYAGGAHRRPLSKREMNRLLDTHFGLRILEQFDGLKGRAICDIGCSYGNVLQAARYRGARVTGVELDTEACRHLRDDLGIAVHHDLADCPGGQDAVCAFSVLEHIADPRSFLEAIHRVCRDDGRLFLSMPNGGNYEMMGPGWAGFRVDLEHVNYFTLPSLSRLLASVGFYVEQYWFLNQLCTNRDEEGSGFWERLANRFRGPRWEPQLQGYATLAVLARKVPAE